MNQNVSGLAQIAHMFFINFSAHTLLFSNYVCVSVCVCLIMIMFGCVFRVSLHLEPFSA